MPTTATYGWTTPASSAANDVPTDLASLANQIEATLSARLGRVAYAEAAGSFSAGQRSGANYTHVINFPAGRFSVAPVVTAMVANSASGSNMLQVVLGTVTSTTAEIIFLTDTGAALANHWCTATWHAVQMTSTTAAG